MLLSAAVLAATVLTQDPVFRIPETQVLVFSKTAAFRHGSIGAGKKMFEKLSMERAWITDYSEDSSVFTSDKIAKYDVIVFLSTTGDVLGDAQQKAMEGWMGEGRGYIGIHAAADTEYDWSWYGSLVGGYFLSHPAQQVADVHIEATGHPTMKHLPRVWRRKDEWYDYRTNPRGKVQVLATLDTSTYTGHKMGGDHPIVWCQELKGGGRMFYSGLGHTDASYTEDAFVEMIAEAVRWVCKR